MSLAAALAWQRGDQASVAWLVWPACVAGAVIADRLMRSFESYQHVSDEAEETRKLLRTVLRRQSEMASALTEIRNSAHRLAQPLTAAVGYSELLAIQSRDMSPACAEQVALLKSAVDRIAKDAEALYSTAREATR